jgi:hypothetical protein
MVLDQFDTTALTEEQKVEIREKVSKKIAEGIDRNYRNREKNRVNKFVAADALANSANRFVDKQFEELDKSGNSGVLSKEVRDAIKNIKFNVKHEKTKKGSIGTITDLDRRLRHMRDIL